MIESIGVLSERQTVTFTQYVRLVLPLDGFVFWVRANLLSPSSLYNAYAYNRAPYDSISKIAKPAPTIVAQGSFHLISEQHQEQEQTMGVHQCIFTAEQQIQDFNQIAPNVIYIANVNGVRFAFNHRDSYYSQAGIHHYSGHAIYSIMESQIIDSPQDFDTRNVVVSNSLPVWLTLNQFFPVYPSFLVPENVEPIFASVHIEPSETAAIQMAPWLDSQSSHFQLVQDSVTITMYGTRNFNALDFVDYVNQYTLNNDGVIGISNLPVMLDEKRTQEELNVIAMKKSITYEVNYYQTRMNNIARQLILSCIPTFYAGSIKNI
ncbi:hypothetical protein WM24_23830 [Burkholderia ubonensis]|nr:hypothetical protein WM24_23830 [Burkholderia ubonensis]